MSGNPLIRHARAALAQCNTPLQSFRAERLNTKALADLVERFLTVIEQTHTPSDDERGALAQLILELRCESRGIDPEKWIDDDAIEHIGKPEADRILAAGFRRSVLPVPQGEHESAGVSEKCRSTAVPQGEPSDASGDAPTDHAPEWDVPGDVPSLVAALGASSGVTDDPMALAWHALSDHAADGTPFGGLLCNCEPIAGRARQLGWGATAGEPFDVLHGEIGAVAFEDGIDYGPRCGDDECECVDHDSPPQREGTYITIRLVGSPRVGLWPVRVERVIDGRRDHAVAQRRLV